MKEFLAHYLAERFHLGLGGQLIRKKSGSPIAALDQRTWSLEPEALGCGRSPRCVTAMVFRTARDTPHTCSSRA
jgi:hypothetical protein